MPPTFLHFTPYNVFLGWLLFTLEFQLSKKGAREDQRLPVPAAKHQWIVVTSVTAEVTEGAGRCFVYKGKHLASFISVLAKIPNLKMEDGDL